MAVSIALWMGNNIFNDMVGVADGHPNKPRREALYGRTEATHLVQAGWREAAHGLIRQAHTRGGLQVEPSIAEKPTKIK